VLIHVYEIRATPLLALWPNLAAIAGRELSAGCERVCDNSHVRPGALGFLGESATSQGCFAPSEKMPANSRALGLEVPSLLATASGWEGEHNLPRAGVVALQTAL
jgi:hypothetical protein